MTRPRVLLASAVLFMLGLPALLARDVARHVWDLFARIEPSAPYFATVDPLYLYGLLPLTVLGSLTLVMAPGLLLVMAWADSRTAEEWMLQGFALSLVVLGVASSFAQSLAGSVTGGKFVALCLALTLLSGALAWWRAPDRAAALASDQARVWPRFGPGHAATLLGVPLLFLAALLPKFFWESFNSDGAHAYEATRLLLNRPLPFWEPGSGKVAAYPGLNSMLYLVPSSWFMRLFGEIEAAVRLPYLLFMGLLYAAVVAAARQARPGRLSPWVPALIWAGVLGFSLVMAYSATYDPYCADIGLPATQDALLMACFLAMTTAFLRGQRGWAALFTGFVLLCSPAGPVLIGGWFLAVLIGFRARPWARLLAYAAGAAACVAVMGAIPDVLSALGLPAPGGEHAAGALLSKFRYVLATEFERLGWMALPCGIYPLWALTAWRRADDGSRALLLVWALVVALYYMMAFVSLHYFVPAMVLPLAAFWRVHRPVDWGARRAVPALLVCSLLALVSIGLGLPTTTAIYTATRTVGTSLDASRMAGYGEMRASYFRGAELLENLFVPGWALSVPEEHYAGGALAWNFYAQRARTRTSSQPLPEAVYLLRPRTAESESLPANALLIAEDDEAALYTLDPDRWEAHRTMHPAGSTWHRVYDVPRDILFGRKRAFERYPILDVKDLLSRKGP